MACDLMATTHRRNSTIIAEDSAYDADRADLKTQYATAVARLEQIRDTASPTNAQVVQALRDVAQIQLRVLKYIRGL